MKSVGNVWTHITIYVDSYISRYTLQDRVKSGKPESDSDSDSDSESVTSCECSKKDTHGSDWSVTETCHNAET